jgi:hypothetical protein
MNYSNRPLDAYIKPAISCCFVAMCAISICFVSALNIKAQAITSYTFSATSGTFTPLSGATAAPLINGDADDGAYGGVPIGFSFRYNDTAYTQISPQTNGWATFIVPTTSFNRFNNLATGTVRPIIAPLWDDLDMSVGSVSYQTTGTAPNRVFTLQWLNARWDYQGLSPAISFQVKFYETTNRVQFVYRQEAGAISNTEGGASIGITGTLTGSGNFLSLNNSGTSPTASSTTETPSIATKPANGQTYNFTPPPPSAAGVSIGGKILTSYGRGLNNAVVILTDSEGNSYTTRSNPFGYYRFKDVEAGETYVISINSKRFTFNSQVIQVNDNISDLNFTALP